MVARYRVTERTFIAPYMLDPGSIIETSSPAGDHLEPLNDEARDAMEVFYNTEVDVKDENGKVLRTIKPNINKRPVNPENVEVAKVELIKKEDFAEVPIVGVVQDRINAGVPGELIPTENVEPAPINVDNDQIV